MTCPLCREDGTAVRKGTFKRRTGARRLIQRYRCKACRRSFSEQTGTLTYRERKPHLDQKIFLWLNAGVSQRRIARNLNTTPKTVARKLVRLGRHAAIDQDRLVEALPPVREIVFDEMETFEHSKCKPLSIALAVAGESRIILCAQVAVMPAKGRLAAVSRRRYGKRPDRRRRALRRVLGTARRRAAATAIVKSDECPRYPPLVAQILPHLQHQTHKGRRGCVVGQGELKRGGFDPLFSLNHTCAMHRDNLKRLARRTWCTTKRADRLQLLVDIYASYHNQWLKGCRRPRVVGARRN